MNLTNRDLKKKFIWENEEQETFEELKPDFTTAPILCHFIPDRKTVVETDASDYALGCVLSQFEGEHLHPVASHSRIIEQWGTQLWYSC